MNREIKFRGKRTDNKQWVCGFYTKSALHEIEKIRYQLADYTWIDTEVIPETVGQFVCMIPNTSMYVDNSRELYEGDLIRHNGNKTIYQVTFGNCRFYGISNEGDKWGVFTCSLSEKKSLEKIEIIGNIHDNKLEDYEND
jgi:hypothetical protein